MNAAFPDADRTGYQSLVTTVHLPDPNDRHVVAAAIRGNAQAIVTFNLKDFPLSTLSNFNIDVQHPDIFVSSLIHRHKAQCERALHNQIKSLMNPPKSRNEVLETLRDGGLIKSVGLLKG